GANGDQVAHLPLQLGDVELQLLAPVVDAVPVEGAPLGVEQGGQLRPRGGPVEAVALGVAGRQVLLPEVVVEVEVEQGAIHVEQDGVDGAPVEGDEVVGGSHGALCYRAGAGDGRPFFVQRRRRGGIVPGRVATLWR